MTFTSATFLFFLLAFASLYWGIPRRSAQNVLIVFSSYFFYAWWDWRFCGLMLLSTMTDFFVARRLGATEAPGARKRLVWVSVAVNLGVLGFFKYFNFFADSLVDFAAAIGWQLSPVVLQIALPVGISFYTFQTMSYTIDVYRRHLAPVKSPVEYLAFVSFFPQLVAGPIERAGHLIPQFQRERPFNRAAVADGVRLMLWGFTKKMLVADNLAPVVEGVFSSPASHAGPAVLAGVVAFAVQIYCDFSGYSDIARGLARCFGFDLMRNFNLPYFASSMREFWRRWHISLSTWFRDYVYVPLGGSRVPPARQWVNLMLTFTLSGLWHGASWNFVIWGALNGLFVLAGSRAADAAGAPPWNPLRQVRTFSLVCLGWVFFRAATFGDAATLLGRLFRGWGGAEAWDGLMRTLDDSPLRWRAVVVAAAVLGLERLFTARDHPLAAIGHWPRPLRWALYTGLIWLLIGWGTWSSGGQFIYFQF